MMAEKEWLSKLKPLASNNIQWQAYEQMLEYYLVMQSKKLEQATEPAELYRAQGAIAALRKLKTLRDEIHASN
jgi:hypothetical protein